MFNALLSRHAALCAVLAASPILLGAPLPCPAAESAVQPQLQALIDKYLRRDPNYKPGDLITRGNVEPIFNDLVDAGFVMVDNSEELYDVFLPDGAFLAQFARGAGRDFIRQVWQLPDAYDRLERLSWSKTGQAWLQQLAASKEGPELFKQLLTEKGLAAMEEQLKGDGRARNFRLPTGHIRNEKELLVRLERVVNAAIAKKAKPAKDAGAKSQAKGNVAAK